MTIAFLPIAGWILVSVIASAFGALVVNGVAEGAKEQKKPPEGGKDKPNG